MAEMQAVFIIILFSICVFMGIPIAFSITLPAICVVLMNGIDPKVVAQQFINGPTSFTLLAVPFFIAAGNMMNTSGVSKRIFDFCMSIMGQFKGGLAYVNVLASMIFAGISGSAMADAAGLGKIEMKAMEERGYDKEFSAAITAASSVIGPIIPPSIIMIMYANSSGVSVAKMFKGGFLPGVLIGLALMASVFYSVKRGVKVGPSEPFSWKNVIKTFLNSFLSLGAPLIILAGMFSGKFTPTEAGVVAFFYSILVGVIYGEFRVKDLPAILRESAITTGNCMYMTAGATLLGWVVTYTRIPQLLANLMLSITDSKYVFIFLVIIFVIILGCLIESIAGLLIIAPILVPVATQYEIDTMHFGMILCLGMMIGVVTPPMGPCLYAVCGISGAKFEGTVKHLMPMLAMLLVALLLVAYIPSITLWLPSIWT